MYAIQADRLVKEFTNLTALNGVDLEIPAGEIVGCVGPNGAGKTTLIRILNGVLSPTSGSVAVFGQDPFKSGRSLRRKTGILPEFNSLYENLSAAENLIFAGSLYGLKGAALRGRAAELLDMFGLGERAGDRVSTYSAGMKKKLALARSIVHSPELIFLDEPTATLDPAAARMVNELISDLAGLGHRTIFMATHNLANAEQICSYIVFLSHGKVIAKGPPAELIEQAGGTLWVNITFETDPPRQLVDHVARLPMVTESACIGAILRTGVLNFAGVASLIEEIVNLGGRIIQVLPKRTSLEDAYFQLIDEKTEGQSRPPRSGYGAK